MDGGGGGGMMTPGYRFYPTEEELISFYLKHKIQCSSSRLQQIDRVIPQLHVYDFYPWDLPQYAGEHCQGDTDSEQWFFFIPRQEKEARGGRPSRLTSSGYWKATGSPSVVYSSGNRGIGIKRTMVFYNGRAPTGKKTKWKMNEYKAFQKEVSSKANPKPKINKIQLMHEFGLCRLYVKSNCLRAFDRRPSTITISEPQHVQQILQNDNHRAVTHLMFNRPSRMKSSLDHSCNPLEDESSAMDTDNRPLWDWEEHCN